MLPLRRFARCAARARRRHGTRSLQRSCPRQCWTIFAAIASTAMFRHEAPLERPPLHARSNPHVMELQRLQRVVVDALEDIKAQDIKVFNTVGQSDMFDRVVAATGNSNRQTRALAWHVVQKVKEAGGAVTSVEGADPGEWVLV